MKYTAQDSNLSTSPFDLSTFYTQHLTVTWYNHLGYLNSSVTVT